MKKLKKIAWIILFSVTGMVALFFIWRTTAYLLDDEPNKTYLLPQIESSRVWIKSISSSRSEMVLDMEVNNHLPFPVKARNITYTITVDEKELIGGEHKKPVRLEMGGASSVTLPMMIYKDDFRSVIKANDEKQKDSVEYQLDFSFDTDVFGERNMNLRVKRTLPMYHFPDMTTEYTGIDSVKLKKAVINLLVSVDNPNIFPLQTHDIDYRFSIDDYDWIEGVIEGKTVFESKTVTQFNLPVDIPYGQVSKTFFDLLKQGEELKYVLELRFTLESGRYFISKTNVILKNSNSVKQLLKKD